MGWERAEQERQIKLIQIQGRGWIGGGGGDIQGQRATGPCVTDLISLTHSRKKKKKYSAFSTVVEMETLVTSLSRPTELIEGEGTYVVRCEVGRQAIFTPVQDVRRHRMHVCAYDRAV